MSEREPATRHLRADELREQLELLSEERKTTLYRRRPPLPAESAISGPSERTVTMLDACIEALAGQPSLGIGTAREPEDKAASQPGDADKAAVRRAHLSDTYRLPRLGKKGPLIGGAVALLSLAILAAAVAWSSSPRVNAERVVPQGSSELAPPLAANLGARETPAATAVPASRAPAAPPVAPNPTSEPTQRSVSVAAEAEPTPLAAQPPVARSPSVVRPSSARHAVELLLAGRTRDALDAYRALVAEPGSAAELAVVVSMLEHELASCAADKESERCAR